MALGFWVSLSGGGRISSRCGVARGVPRHDIRSDHLPAGQFLEKDVRFASLSNSRCVFKCHWDQFLLSSPRVQPHSDIQVSQELRQSGRPEANSPHYLLPLQAIPKDAGSGPLSPGPAREKEGLQPGITDNSVHRVVDLRAVRVLVCSCRHMAHHLARPSPLSFHEWHTFPSLAKTLAKLWGRGKISVDGWHMEAATGRTCYLIGMVFGAWTKYNC